RRPRGPQGGRRDLRDLRGGENGQGGRDAGLGIRICGRVPRPQFSEYFFERAATRFVGDSLCLLGRQRRVPRAEWFCGGRLRNKVSDLTPVRGQQINWTG